MKKNSLYILSGGCFLLFCILIVLLLTVDVAEIGPMQSSVGLSTLNAAVRDAVGESSFFYTLSEAGGIAALVLMAAFATLGAYRLLKTRTLGGVGKDIWLLGGVYVLLAAIYVLFEVLVLNYRPILEEGVLEPSFPSSHTVLALTVMGTAAVWVTAFLKRRSLRITATVLCCALSLLTVVARFLSGVHWFTDILGGILISLGFVFGYLALLIQTEEYHHGR